MSELAPLTRFFDAEFECPKCGRRFPTHYKVTKGFLDRKQFGRRWVCSWPNVCRHIDSCKENIEKVVKQL